MSNDDAHFSKIKLFEAPVGDMLKVILPFVGGSEKLAYDLLQALTEFRVENSLKESNNDFMKYVFDQQQEMIKKQAIKIKVQADLIRPLNQKIEDLIVAKKLKGGEKDE